MKNEVGECLPALILISNQLSDVSSVIERSVLTACQHFSLLGQHAFQMRQLCSTSESDEQYAGFCRTIDTLEALVDVIDGTVDQTRSLQTFHQHEAKVREVHANFRHKLESKMAAIEDNLKAIDAPYVAESLQAMEQLQRVIAEQSELEVEMAQSSTVALSEIEAKLAETADQLRTAVGSFHGVAKSNLHDSVEIAELAMQINSETVQSVSVMQFQDSISQRIEHLVEILQSIATSLNEHFPTDQISSPDAENTWMIKLANSYSMESERKMHILSEGTERADAPEQDVELF